MGFRPNTQRNYNSMYKLFLGFCVFINVYMKNLNVGTIMTFLEFLVCNGASFASVSNHVSAVKACWASMVSQYPFLINLRLNFFLNHCKSTDLSPSPIRLSLMSPSPDCKYL